MIGDIPDFVRRLRAALPKRWFPDSAPVLTGVLTGFAASWSYLFSLLQYVIHNVRLATATGVFLDMIALDFFQGRITRHMAEPDTHFRLRILAEILRPRATRGAVDQALFDLTGQHPIIFEPSLASDTGGYNIGGVGYDVAGGYGSLLLPFQYFITAFRPAGGGIANTSGYGNIALGISTTGGLGGYGQGAIEWASLDMVQGAISDSDIYASVAAAIPAATIGWTRGLAATAVGQTQQLRPAGGFSRSVSTARAAISIIAGALISAYGQASSFGRVLSTGIATAGMNASGTGQGYGALLPQSGMLTARSKAAGWGRAVLSGGGLFGASGRAQSIGRAVMAGTLPLFARGAAKAFGNQLYGSVIILGGRAFAKAVGSATSNATTALSAAGKALSKGKSVVATAGGASLVSRGRGNASGRFNIPALAAALRGRGQSSAYGQNVIGLLNSAPTKPDSVTASNPTPNTMTLTWAPSTGGP